MPVEIERKFLMQMIGGDLVLVRGALLPRTSHVTGLVAVKQRSA